MLLLCFAHLLLFVVVFQCSFCAPQCPCMVVVLFPRGLWGTVGRHMGNDKGHGRRGGVSGTNFAMRNVCVFVCRYVCVYIFRSCGAPTHPQADLSIFQL